MVNGNEFIGPIKANPFRQKYAYNQGGYGGIDPASKTAYVNGDYVPDFSGKLTAFQKSKNDKTGSGVAYSAKKGIALAKRDAKIEAEIKKYNDQKKTSTSSAEPITTISAESTYADNPFYRGLAEQEALIDKSNDGEFSFSEWGREFINGFTHSEALGQIPDQKTIESIPAREKAIRTRERTKK